MKPTFIDKSGARVELDVPVTVYKAAVDSNLSVPQYINRMYPTSPDAQSSTFDQLCASCGLIKHANKEFGLKSPTIAQVFDGSAVIDAGVIVKEASPASRTLFPAVILEAVTDKLYANRDIDPVQFDRMVALDTVVTQDRVEQPQINYDRPEAMRAKPISQLAKPAAMMGITVADVSRALPTFSLGLEISDQAMRATTLDLVTLAVNRQAKTERDLMNHEHLLAMLQGNADLSQDALSHTHVNSYDATCDASGDITKLALLSWLFHNRSKRTIDWIVTDLTTMIAIDTALATTNTGVGVISGFQNTFTLTNALLKNVNFFVADANWPAYTLMGIDSTAAIHRIRNSAAAYAAVEEFVLQRKQALRFDFSEICFRQFDDAFDVLLLTTS